MKRGSWACCLELVCRAGVICWAILALIYFAPSPAHANALVLVLDKAQWIASSKTSPPQVPSQAVDLSLPHDWRQTPPPFEGVAMAGWYRIHFDWPVAARNSQTLLVPRVGVAAEFWLNGERLGAEEVEFGERPTRMWNRPQMFAVRPELLSERGNELMVRVQGHSHLVSGLSAMQLGPRAQLQRAYQWRWLAQVAAPWVLAGVCMLMGFAALAFYVRSRRRELLPFFALGMFQAPRAILPVLEYPPFSISTGIWVTAFTHICFGGAFLWLLRPLTARWHPTWNRWAARFIALLLLSWLAFGALGIASQRSAAIHLLPVLLAAAFATVALFRQLWTSRAWGALGVCMVAFVLNGMGWGHDVLHRLGHVAFDNISLGPLTAIPSYFCMLWIAAQTYANDERAAALARREAEAVARTQERERLLADMHDGLGAQLIASISRAKRTDLSRPQAVQELQAVLDELRLVMDARQTEDFAPAVALRMLCDRLSPRFEEQGCTLHCDAHEAAAIELNAKQRLSLLRTAQTALANVLQHARASRCEVCLHALGDAWVLEISDNGRGFNTALPAARGHYGLQNLQRRAEELGASLELQSGDGKTSVRLSTSSRG